MSKIIASHPGTTTPANEGLWREVAPAGNYVVPTETVSEQLMQAYQKTEPYQLVSHELLPLVLFAFVLGVGLGVVLTY